MYNNGMQLFHKKSTFYFLLAGTFVMIVIMFITGKPLNTATTPHGILNLEFADSKQKVDSILSAWENASTAEKDIIKAAKINTWLDFLFLLFYGLFLYSCCIRLSQALHQHKIISRLLHYFAFAALVVGLLDVLENIGMLTSLAGKGSDSIAKITSTISVVKWLLVFSVILSIIAGLAAKYFFKRKTSEV